MRYLAILGLILCALSFAGCGTTEGGSSLPWSRPESWENQAVPSMGQQE